MACRHEDFNTNCCGSLPPGANWAGEDGGAIAFRGTAPASLTMEHVAFLDNGVSEPGGRPRDVDVQICPSPGPSTIGTNAHYVWRPVQTHTTPCRIARGRRARCWSLLLGCRFHCPLSDQAELCLPADHTMSLSFVRSAALFTGSMGSGSSSQPIWRVDNGTVYRGPYGNHTYRVSKYNIILYCDAVT